MKKYFAVFVLIIFLFGCAPVTFVSTTTPVPTLEPDTLTPSATARLFFAPSTPVPSKTPTPASISVVIPTPEDGIQVRCVDASSIPQGKWGDGQVVLGNRKMLKNNDRYELGSFLLDMTTGQVKNLDEPPNYYYFVDSVSPDRSKLAVGRQRVNENDQTIILDSEITILTSDGAVLKQITPSISWQVWSSAPTWLDNEHIIIDIAGLDADEATQRKLSTSMVLDPYSLF